MPEKKKRGRPKTSVAQKLSSIQFDLQKIETMAAEGLTDVMIASILSIDEATLNRWKADKSFVQALKRGKDTADRQVVKSLYQRAIGYDDKNAVYFSNYKGEVSATPYVKHYAPDVLAQIFWLKNRQSVDWRDRQDITSDGEKIDAIKVIVVKKK